MTSTIREIKLASGAPSLVLHPSKVTGPRLVAAWCLLGAMFLMVGLIGVAVVRKAALLLGPPTLLVGTLTELAVLGAALAGILYAGWGNQKARIVLDGGRIRFFGFGGRLEREFPQSDVRSVVLLRQKAGRGTVVQRILLLDEQGRWLLKTGGSDRSWSGELPKLWHALAVEPRVEAEPLSGREIATAYPPSPSAHVR